MTVVLLILAAFLSGIFASLAGGGGIIQLPAILILMPELAVSTAMGTNKIAFLFAAVSGILSYRKHVRLNYKAVFFMTAVACICSWIGSHVVTGFSQASIRPIIFGLFIFIFIFTYFKNKDTQKQWIVLSPSWQFLFSIIVGGAVGFYNGFFGPGAGALFVFFAVHLLGYNFLSAMAAMQILCGLTDLSSAFYFGITGQILYGLAIIMGISNGLGAHFGARIAIYKGSQFVRKAMLCLIVLLLLRLAKDIWL